MKTVADIRRRPVQARSKTTTEFVLQATLDLIAERGYEALTTNHIAERAGVNIGSVYRYFPNKDAIVTALYEQTASRAALIMKTALLEWLQVKIDEAMPQLVRIFLKIFQDHELILLRLPQQLPSLRLVAAAYEIDRLIHSVSRLYFEQHSLELAFEDVETALFFTQNNILANVSHFILSKPEHISQETFVQELSRSILAYLRSH